MQEPPAPTPGSNANTPIATAIPTQTPGETPTPLPPPIPYGGPPEGIWLPLPPSTDAPGRQGGQQRLVSVATGHVCEDARVAIGTNGSALCYAHADGGVRCAGVFGGEIPSSTSFVDTGRTGVDQILLSPHSPQIGESAMCVHQTDGTAWCRGTLSWQDGGQFNLGEDGNPGATWRQWGDRSDIVELATSQWKQMCARYEDGTAECTGYASATGGLTYTQSRYPFLIGGPSPPVDAIWVDVFGAVRVNDPNVHRAADDGHGCTVGASGLFCRSGPIADAGWETTWGIAGNVVHGGLAGNRQYGPSPSLGAMTVCWLEGQGAVTCYDGATQRPFADVPGHAIALAVSHDLPHTWGPYGVGPARCAVFDDGSLWCIGRNDTGAFGIGGTQDLAATQVAPPHSVRIACTPSAPTGDNDNDDDDDDDRDNDD